MKRACLQSTRGGRAMLRRALVAMVFGMTALWGAAASADVKEIPWGTSAVGSSGHRALVALADLLNKEMPEYRVTAQPTPGAIVSVKGYTPEIGRAHV